MISLCIVSVLVLVILVLEHITKNIYFSRHQPNKNFLSRHKFSPHLLSWAPKVEGHSFAGEVINMSSMKLGIRQAAQNNSFNNIVVGVSQLQTAQLHCCNSHTLPAQRLAHSAAGRSLAPMQQSVWERGINTRIQRAISLVPRLPRSGTRTLKLYRRGEPGIFCHVKSAKSRRR